MSLFVKLDSCLVFIENSVSVHRLFVDRLQRRWVLAENAVGDLAGEFLGLSMVGEEDSNRATALKKVANP